MHELGILYQLAETATKYAEENDIETIKVISIEVGELSGALPYIFTEYFPLVSKKYPRISNAELKVDTHPGEGLCCNCHALYNVMKNNGKCPRCGSMSKKILGGTEINLTSIGF